MAGTICNIIGNRTSSSANYVVINQSGSSSTKECTSSVLTVGSKSSNMKYGIGASVSTYNLTVVIQGSNTSTSSGFSTIKTLQSQVASGGAYSGTLTGYLYYRVVSTASGNTTTHHVGGMMLEG